MNDLRYALIRFIPDAARMEPINFGVVLQGAGKIDFKLHPNFARRKDVETAVFQQWRDFLVEEIRGEDMPLFQPRKDSVEFLTHLAALCEQTVSMTRPLVISTEKDESFEDTLDSLFGKLVLPLESPKPESMPRPTSRFREIEEEKQFRRRGMKKHPYLTLPGDKRWNAYRQLLNGENIVIDKIEVRNEVGLTADEIQKLASGVESFLERFLKGSTQPTRYYLLADDLTEKFTDQPDSDFAAMKEELEHVVHTVEDRGGVVLRRAEEVVEFANQIDQKLPPVNDSGKC